MGGGGVAGFYAVNGQPTVPLCEYGIYMGDSQKSCTMVSSMIEVCVCVLQGVDQQF